MRLLMTMVVGVASVLIAGMLIGGLLVAVVAGVLLVAAWSRFVEPRGTPGWRRILQTD